MNAIPTHYNGINFRSRLEAKWARFFDLIGWSYEYEPVDLNGYIPDFVLKFAKMPIYVEIKPSMTVKDLISDCQKARVATLGKRLLCLGGTCDLPDEDGVTFGPFGVQVVRLNLCDQDFADLEIECFGKGDQNFEKWDLDDPSTEMCVIGTNFETEINSCMSCDELYPRCIGYTTCPHCGDDNFGRNWEDYLSVRSHIISKWKEAGNTTQYKRIFKAGKG